jgi:hypothetical protein
MMIGPGMKDMLAKAAELLTAAGLTRDPQARSAALVLVRGLLDAIDTRVHELRVTLAILERERPARTAEPTRPT